MAPPSDYVSWLRLRRARVVSVALALADRAAERGHGFSPGEQRQYDALDAALVNIDNRLNQAWIEDRAGPPGRGPLREGRVESGRVWDWAGDNDGASYSAAPGSGSQRTLRAFRA
jgi:hypothetical protein